MGLGWCPLLRMGPRVIGLGRRGEAGMAAVDTGRRVAIVPYNLGTETASQVTAFAIDDTRTTVLGEGDDAPGLSAT